MSLIVWCWPFEASSPPSLSRQTLPTACSVHEFPEVIGASPATVDVKGRRFILAVKEDHLNRAGCLVGEEKRLAKFDILQHQRVAHQRFHPRRPEPSPHRPRRAAPPRPECGGHPDKAETLVQRGFPEMGSRKMRRHEMPAEKRMAPCLAPNRPVPRATWYSELRAQASAAPVAMGRTGAERSGLRSDRLRSSRPDILRCKARPSDPSRTVLSSS